MSTDPLIKYDVSEIFYSLQGEGVRTGTAATFVRLAGCNLLCLWCDTNHTKRMELSADQIVAYCNKHPRQWIVLTGGEPLLQNVRPLVRLLRQWGWRVALETNGTIRTPGANEFDWIAVSPKHGHDIHIGQKVDEIRVVLRAGESLWRPENLHAHNLTVSPRFNGEKIDMEAVQWCVQLVKENPEWRLSIQTQKVLSFR